MKTKLLILASLFSTMLFAQTSPIWVSPYGSGLGDGSSPYDAVDWPSLSMFLYNRIDINHEYDFELWLLDGVYSDYQRLHYTDSNVYMVNTIRIFGGFNGSENTVFDRDLSTYRSTIELNSHVGLHIEGPDLIIVDGLSFTAESEYADSAALNLVGAEYTYVSKCRFEKINIPTLDQLLKTENGNATTKYINCLVDNCECTAIFGSTGDVDVINCTIVENKLDVLNVYWGGYVPSPNFQGANLLVYNSIVYDNTYYNGHFPPNGTTIFSYSGIDALETWMVDDGTCSYVNPQFSYDPYEPYMLDLFSPYIGYGNTVYLTSEPYILQEHDIISNHRYADANHSCLDAGAYQTSKYDQDDPDFSYTGFDFDFIILDKLKRGPIRHFQKVPYNLNVSSHKTHNGVYSIGGLKLAETTDNLPSGLYMVNGKIQWIP